MMISWLDGLRLGVELIKQNVYSIDLGKRAYSFSCRTTQSLIALATFTVVSLYT